MARTRPTGKRTGTRQAAVGQRPRSNGSSRTGSKKTSPSRVPRKKGRQPAAAAEKRRSPGSASALGATAQAVGRTLGVAAAAVARRIPWRAGREDAIGLLEADHRRLEALLNDGEKTTARATRRRAEILKTIARELTAHEQIEEELLYPALKPHAEATDIVLEGYQEHHVADVVLKELLALRPSDERWGAKFKVFKENIEHHIEEEEGEMFKKARSVLTGADLRALGARMRARRREP